MYINTEDQSLCIVVYEIGVLASYFPERVSFVLTSSDCKSHLK